MDKDVSILCHDANSVQSSSTSALAVWAMLGKLMLCSWIIFSKKFTFEDSITDTDAVPKFIER